MWTRQHTCHRWISTTPSSGVSRLSSGGYDGGADPVSSRLESPDPFNTEVDSMNFDFLAHPPPGQPQQQYYF